MVFTGYFATAQAIRAGGMSCIAGSYMARRGVAKGKPGTTHHLNKAMQRDYHYVYRPYALIHPH